MGFLIRSVFWLSLLFLFLPIGGQTGEESEEMVGPLQALFAAREVVQDMVGICERQPDVCATGRAALKTISTRAQESARMAYEMLEQGNAEPEPEGPAITGSIPAEE